MNTILIPGTHRFISEGAIIKLSNDPNTKWILKYGWFLDNSESVCGWYISAIPSLQSQRLTDEMLFNCVVIAEGEGVSPGPYSCDTTPAECPFADPAAIRHDIERYLKNTEYTAGQLLWIEAGILYQAAEDFTSSNEEGTAEENMLLDVQAGLLVPIS